MKLDIHTDKIKRQRLQLRLAIRKLKRWGDELAAADSDIARLRAINIPSVKATRITIF